jgi:hypothetical protein
MLHERVFGNAQNNEPAVRNKRTADNGRNQLCDYTLSPD